MIHLWIFWSEIDEMIKYWSETQGRGRWCLARGLQGPSKARSVQPGDGYDDDGKDDDDVDGKDDDDIDGIGDDVEQCDLFCQKELWFKLGVDQVKHVQHWGVIHLFPKDDFFGNDFN